MQGIGDVPGVDVRITPTGRNVLNAAWQEMIKGGETNQNSMASKIEEHQTPGEQPVTTMDRQGVTRDQPPATTDTRQKT